MHAREVRSPERQPYLVPTSETGENLVPYPSTLIISGLLTDSWAKHETVSELKAVM